jgi:hypothetical protein
LQVERELGEPDRPERGAEQRDELDLGVVAVDPDELGAELGDLPVGASPPRAPAHDGRLVEEADRRRSIAEAGGDEPGDLGSHVGAQGRDLARLGLHEAEDVAGAAAPEAALEGLVQLERGRDDRIVAVQGRGVGERVGEVTPRARLLGEEVAHADRERVERRRGHGGHLSHDGGAASNGCAHPRRRRDAAARGLSENGQRLPRRHGGDRASPPWKCASARLRRA